MDAVPVLLELVERIDLLSPEIRRKFRRLITDLLVDAVAQAVRGVGADDERAIPKTSRT